MTQSPSWTTRGNDIVADIVMKPIIILAKKPTPTMKAVTAMRAPAPGVGRGGGGEHEVRMDQVRG